MRINRPLPPSALQPGSPGGQPRWGGRRFFSISMLVVGLIIGSVELSVLIPIANPTLVKAANLTDSEVFSANESISTYRWNLNDDGLPLVSLPDHIRGNLDLSLTYSMGQFQFPLFQSLYFNERVGKYILMVIQNRGRRAQFIDLDPVEGWGQFEAKDDSRLRLADKGNLKLLSTSEGTVYTFAAFEDGELHCSRINDRAGLVINLKYTVDSSIDTISDSSGRTMRFSYTNDYVSAVTQTWGADSAKLTKTWAIDVRLTTGPTVNRGDARSGESKHIPTNAIKGAYTDEMVASDWLLAQIFGGPGAVAAANGFEPGGLGSQYPLYRGDLISDDGKTLRGHLSFAMHLYGSEDGTGETELYVPLGFISNSSEPTPTDAAVTFYYPKLGNLTDATLAVFHVANFHLSYEGGRVRIGSIGGPGGSIGSYRHAHIEFYRGNTGLPSASSRVKLRIDPVSVFARRPISPRDPKPLGTFDLNVTELTLRRDGN
jgi:hypothetical protein